MAKKIACLCEQFLSMNGDGSSLMGGGERYWTDIIELFKRMGFDVSCYQFSREKWVQKYKPKNITMHGLGNITGKTLDYIEGINLFYEIEKNADAYFLLSPNLALVLQPQKKPVLSVSHGLVFDGAMPGQQQNPIGCLDAYKKFVRNISHVISVDTLSIKIMQIYDQRLANKFTYIPNYVSLEQFLPDEKLEGIFNVIFARRLQWCRGYTTMIAAVDILREKYPNQMNFYFVGRGNELEEKHFKSWYDKNSKNIFHISYEMNDMYKAYKNMHISCIPTIMAEGTSLSCIESQAMGAVPIVTVVGGLNDLIFDGFNGKVIMPDDSRDYFNPNPTKLVEAIEYMYHNPSEVIKMRENGYSVVKSFSKDIWEKKISTIVKQVYGESNE
jgi:glycosyltransferase involved in cell wall biosynthesis